MTTLQRETADYLADACAELAKLAKRQSLDSLTYLLDMAALEAGHVARPKAQAKDAA
jgi:ADP-heptose:LPS heptosyltransferase